LTVSEQSAEQISSESGSLNAGPAGPHASEASIQPVVAAPDLVPGQDTAKADAPKSDAHKADAAEAEATKAEVPGLTLQRLTLPRQSRRASRATF
jgi:hypothetical protein